MKKNVLIVGLIVLLMAVPASLFAAGGQEGGGAAGAGEWRPQRDVEFVAPAAVGGGSDLWMRAMADVINRERLSNVNYMAVNRGGGAGAVGYNFMMSRRGDPHYLLALHTGVPFTSYLGGWPQTFESMIDVVNIMAFDDVFLGTRSDGPYTTIQALLTAARNNPGTIRFGSDQRHNTSQFMFELLRLHAGADMNYVQFDSSGLVATALMGGHVDVGIFNPSEFIGQLESGDFVAIVTFAEQRVPGIFANVPTFIEIGYPQIVLREWRGVAVPPGTPEAAVRYYDQLSRRVMQSPQFQEYLERNYLLPTYMPAAEASAYASSQARAAKELFDRLGL